MVREARSTIGSPCRQCGACCATFRVSFYWAEAAALADSLTEKVNETYRCMAGTNTSAPRCQALRDKVGNRVSCSAYGHRPLPRREVQPDDDKCRSARARHGLSPLFADDLKR